MQNNPVKKSVSIIVFFAFTYAGLTQPMVADTSGGLIEQKDNIITPGTIIKIENLGTRINSVLPELRPTVSADGNHLYFICQNHPANTKYRSVPNSQDIWYSERDSTGKWSDAIHLDYSLNTTHYNAVYWISPDNNRLLLRGAFNEGAFISKGVSMTYKDKDGEWTPPNALFIKNYEKYDRGRQSGASMTHDGETLL